MACGLASVGTRLHIQTRGAESEARLRLLHPPTTCHSLSSPHSGGLPLPCRRPCGPGPFTEPWLRAVAPRAAGRDTVADSGGVPGVGRGVATLSTPPLHALEAPSSTPYSPPSTDELCRPGRGSLACLAWLPLYLPEGRWGPGEILPARAQPSAWPGQWFSSVLEQQSQTGLGSFLWSGSADRLFVPEKSLGVQPPRYAFFLECLLVPALGADG